MQKELIPFNIPHLTGEETKNIQSAVNKRMLSGNGAFTKMCHKYFEDSLGLKKALLTTSCTDALEMCALLINIHDGDEIIMPSYTFVSTANAFVLRGAKIRFVDSRQDHPGMDESKLEELITDRTKAIVPVHYAGVACDMDAINDLAKNRDITVIEDAAQGIDSYYKGKALGSIGDLSTMSFHETKNIISGEGGLLGINNLEYVERSEIIWEKGTNRAAFWRGEVDKYGWVDLGSSFLASDLTAAFLYAQVSHIEDIQERRKNAWNRYWEELVSLRSIDVQLPTIPDFATNNAHMFYLVCRSGDERTRLIQYLKDEQVYALFHYLSLHKSEFYKDKHDGRELPQSDRYTDCLVRLPLYYDLREEDIQRVTQAILKFYGA